MDRARVRVPESTLHVEGTDDREVIYQLCNACKLDNGELFEVRCANGVENLIQLAAIRNSAPTIGFVLDADGDPESRWRALRQSVLPHYPTFPDLPQPGGLIIPRDPGGPSRLGVWLMPDNRLPGMMEDFLLSLANPDDDLKRHAEEVIETLPARRFPKAHYPKALLHTWLAWQEEPGTRPGLAITRKLLRPDRAEGQRFLTWLKELFAPGAP